MYNIEINIGVLVCVVVYQASLSQDMESQVQRVDTDHVTATRLVPERGPRNGSRLSCYRYTSARVFFAFCQLQVSQWETCKRVACFELSRSSFHAPSSHSLRTPRS
jgi:hypothetical protein